MSPRQRRLQQLPLHPAVVLASEITRHKSQDNGRHWENDGCCSKAKAADHGESVVTDNDEFVTGRVAHIGGKNWDNVAQTGFALILPTICNAIL